MDLYRDLVELTGTLPKDQVWSLLIHNMILNHVILPLLFVILEPYEYNKLYQGSARNPNQYFSVTAIRWVTWNAPKSMWKMILSCDRICLKFWNAPKSNNFIFGSFSVLKSITCSNFEMPRFLMFENFEMPHFSYLILKMGKMGHFKIFEHKKAGHFKILARDQF